MIARAGSGWQTVLADLSMILFMVTASAVTEAPAEPQRPARSAAPSARSEPLALYRPGQGAPPLGEWLATQSPDPRQQLTVTVRYAPGEQEKALESAQRLLREAGAAGLRTRVVIEPGTPDVMAALAYDHPGR